MTITPKLSSKVCSLFISTTLCGGVLSTDAQAQTVSQTAIKNQTVITELTQSTTDSVLNVLKERIYKVSEIQGLLNVILSYPRPDVGQVQMADQLNTFGTKAFNEKNYALAAKLFGRAAKANPANLSSWCNLSMASFENKDFKIAQTAALQALILQPHYRDIWILVKNACEQNKEENCQKNAEVVLQELQYIK